MWYKEKFYHDKELHAEDFSSSVKFIVDPKKDLVLKDVKWFLERSLLLYNARPAQSCIINSMSAYSHGMTRTGR